MRRHAAERRGRRRAALRGIRRQRAARHVFAAVSAIAGLVHFDGAPIAPGVIEKMTAAMIARGPDGISHWNKGAIALGQCALRTTPESLHETQPLANEDASVLLVMDGRVDNREELRRDLEARGARLRDDTDAELVLRAFEAWGDE